MFTNFLVTFSLPRDKIMVIKMIRMISGLGTPTSTLKGAKDAVEELVCFDKYMENYVVLKLILDESAMGRLAYYQSQNFCDSGIVDIVGIDPVPACDFDLTFKAERYVDE